MAFVCSMNQVANTIGGIPPIIPATILCCRPSIMSNQITGTVIMAGVGVTDITGKATAKTGDMIATMITTIIARTVITTGIESGLRPV